MSSKVNVLMMGTGEYTTGYVGGAASDSDKGAGVVALTMFDLRRRFKVDRLGMCGVNVSICLRLLSIRIRDFESNICSICVFYLVFQFPKLRNRARNFLEFDNTCKNASVMFMVVWT